MGNVSDGAAAAIAGPSWVEHPDVERMVRLAVKRKIRMYDRYNDLDEDSLVQDMLGECVKARYDPALCQPGTFAYRVATCRLTDISRRRTTEDHHQANCREIEGVRLSHVEADELTEGTEEELAEVARRLYVMAKNLLEGAGIELRPKHLGERYPDKAQRAAMLLLQKHMKWTVRRAAAELRRCPKVLLTLGLEMAPSRTAFSRGNRVVTQFKNSDGGRAAVVGVG
jgi:DNA-directed RNA polymerase specialized sigma24 family protein